MIQQAISNDLFVNVFLGGKFHQVKAPTTKIYSKMLGALGVEYFSDMEKEKTPESIRKAVLIALGKEVKGSQDEFTIAFNEILHMTLAQEYFKDKKTKSEGKSKGGKSLAGQIALFMEDLNMGLEEVLSTSYPLLLILQHDKPRPDFDKKEELSGKDMLKKKRG